MIREEFQRIYHEDKYLNKNGLLKTSKIHTIHTLINKWIANEETLRVNYMIRPTSFRAGGGGRKQSIPTELGFRIYKVIFQMALNASGIVTTPEIKGLMYEIINESGKYRAYYSSAHYSKEDRNQILLSDNAIWRFKQDYQLISSPSSKTYYDPCRLMMLQLGSIIQTLIYRQLLDIKFSLFL